MTNLSRALFGISPREVSFDRRGFRGGADGMRERIESVGRSFLTGYHHALEEDRPRQLAERLGDHPRELRGFVYEGAAMALALQGTLMPWRWKRFETFLQGPGDDHVYMAVIGAGWVAARLPVITDRLLGKLADIDPLLCWLAFDGYGFREGFFGWKKSVEEHRVPGRLHGYARNVFDQGLGRSLWFVEGGDVDRIPETIARFAKGRHADLWSGVGLAATYAGGVPAEALERLARAGRRYAPQLAQGSAFAAKARIRAGNLAEAARLACSVFCNTDARTAADVTDRALEDLPTDPPGSRGPENVDRPPAFEVWRRRIQGHFAEPSAHVHAQLA